jgi:hypothetical protein
VEVLGARQRGIDDDENTPGSIRGDARELVFDPADDRIRTGLFGADWIAHPLAPGSERDYRFASGDTMTVRLSGGETVRVYELRVEPRRLDKPLVSGSIWLEDRDYGVVRTLFRMSHSLNEVIRSESRRDSAGKRSVTVSADVSDSAPRVHRGRGMAMLPEVRIDIRYVTTEFGLVGGRWWMPTLTADATLRIATATGQPDVEIGVRRETAELRLRLAAYRRLTPANPLERPLGIGNSLSAALWGRDNGEFFRATGVELKGAPPRSERPWMEWRLFAEHQGPVSTETDATLRSAFSSFDFRPNIAANRADQAGLALTLRPVADFPLLGIHWGMELGAEGQAGTFAFVRPEAQVRGGVTLGPLAAALEGAAGTSFGDVPVQSLWYLGGPGTLRGYDGGTAAGTAFWRARGEIAKAGGAARLAAFSDLGWAGDRASFSLDRTPLWSAGVGASVLDGLFRVDLARALRRPTGWRLEIYMDGAL